MKISRYYFICITLLYLLYKGCDLSLPSSHAVTADLGVVVMAQAAEFFLSDGVILTGQSTGQPTNEGEVAKVKKATPLPVLVGSGVTANNLGHYAMADAVIVGSYFKEGGRWYGNVIREKVTEFMGKAPFLKHWTS